MTTLQKPSVNIPVAIDWLKNTNEPCLDHRLCQYDQLANKYLFSVGGVLLCFSDGFSVRNVGTEDGRLKNCAFESEKYTYTGTGALSFVIPNDLFSNFPTHFLSSYVCEFKSEWLKKNSEELEAEVKLPEVVSLDGLTAIHKLTFQECGYFFEWMQNKGEIEHV